MFVGKKSVIKEITGGVLGGLADFFLYQIYLVGASVGKTGPRGIYQAFAEADKALEELNHNTLVAVWHELTKKKLITCQKRGNLYYPAVTAYGKKRLQENLPEYQLKRPWDGRIYLVTYDIPETNHAKRDCLRRFLIRIGCKLLQESVFLTPYNPRELINDYLNKETIDGTIIVSDVGRDGGVGETSIQYLIVRLFKLEELNDRYLEFIKDANENTKLVKKLLFDYLAILRDDPQLPFQLLPPGWPGEKAFHIYQKLLATFKL